MSATAHASRFQKHCPGCFQHKGTLAVCPHCGYDESTSRSPLFLPHGVILGGQYRVGRVLGRPGGFGITYLGWDINLQQRVAIKEYLPREIATRVPNSTEVTVHTTEDRRGFEFGKEQFLREARIVAKLDHPNIVRVRNFFNANGTAYLVMDYYEGMSLGDYLAGVRNKLEPELAVPLVRPILDGLQYVHERGLVHRDLKPHNIYLAAIGRPIVLDFGAARQAAGDRVQSLSVVLTEGYAPLEQYQRRAVQGPWTDVYGAAATLYRMITGAAPPIALDRIGRDPVDDGGWAAVPHDLVPALRKALAVRPNDRFQSAAEFRSALDNYKAVAAAAGSPVAAAAEPARPPRPRVVAGDGEVSPAQTPAAPIAAAIPERAIAQPSAAPAVGAPVAAVLGPASTPASAAAPISRQLAPTPITGSPRPVPQASLSDIRNEAISTPRPAGGYPLLSAPVRPEPAPAAPAPLAAAVALPAAELRPTPAASPLPPLPAVRPAPTTPPPPLFHRASEFQPPQPPPPPAKSAVQQRFLLALIFAALGTVIYVLMNPPGEKAVVPAVTATAKPATAPIEAELPPALAPNPPALPVMIGLPGGEIRLGLGGDSQAVNIRPFKLAASETTVAQFRDFVSRTGYANPRWQNYPCESAGGRLPEWDNPGYAQGDDFPVVCMSWSDANAYAQWLSRETGLGFRLPTEAEWEYAARAGTSTRFWWGEQFAAGMAACQSCPPKVPTQPSAAQSFPQNGFGLFEMLGNVREWTCSMHDRYSSGAAGQCGTPVEESRVAVRGGSWQEGEDSLAASHRDAFEPYRRNVWTGFRVAQNLRGDVSAPAPVPAAEQPTTTP